MSEIFISPEIGGDRQRRVPSMTSTTQTAGDKMWNLTPEQWSAVLQSDANPSEVAARLRRSGAFVPWTNLLVEESTDCLSTADLGCGRGEHSAVLAMAGRSTTLIDWSDQNLTFGRSLYEALDLQGNFCRADITRPLPLETNSVDMVFSCGVFEYFNASQVDAIIAEAFRVARRRVIIMVPNARSIAYRIGMWYMERMGKWEWGGEVPSHSLKRHFRNAGCTSIREFSIGGKHAVEFLAPLPGGSRVVNTMTRVLGLTLNHRPTPLQQGYLLVTIGEKTPASR
jgi:SAM-dependent methyltransferase